MGLLVLVIMIIRRNIGSVKVGLRLIIFHAAGKIFRTKSKINLILIIIAA